MSLRPHVILEYYSDIWDIIYSRDPQHLISSVEHQSITPSDENVSGENLIEYAIRRKSFDFVSFYLDNWPNTFLRAGSFRKAAWDACLILHLCPGNVPQNGIDALSHLIHIVDSDDEEIAKWFARILQNPTSLNQLPNALDVVNEICPVGDTLLHAACRFNRQECLQHLLLLGAVIDKTNFQGETPLVLAMAARNFGCVDALLEAGCDVNIASNSGMTALMYAVSARQARGTAVIMKLLELGANVSVLDSAKWSALHYINTLSVSPETIEIRLDLLFDSGSRSVLEVKNLRGHTPLMTAIRWRKSFVVSSLIRRGASFTAVDFSGHNLLHFAVLWPKTEVIDVIREANVTGIDIRTPNWIKDTPLTPLGALRNHKYAKNLNERIRGPRYPPPLLREMEGHFEKMLKSIRDSRLLGEIGEIETITLNLKKGLLDTSRKCLKELEGQKRKDSIEWEVETFRAIEADVRHHQIDLAMESLTELISSFRERMTVSPFDDRENDPLWHDHHNAEKKTRLVAFDEYTSDDVRVYEVEE
ncbi:ankyrin repeat-containing domain protein [Xylariaceae sp. FL1019]|nr:ankyrin repeat-containing domain protein [Xylariaceae sp. FL1019]